MKKNQVYANVKAGGGKNPYDKYLFNIGFLGDGEYVSRKNDKLEDAYEMWSGVMARCYCYPDRYPAYFGKCIVCDEWHNYQNFAKWFEENRYEVNERLHIDKDILFPKTNIYSPEKCLLVPKTIIWFFLINKKKKGLLIEKLNIKMGILLNIIINN